MNEKKELDYIILIPGRSFSTPFVLSMINTVNYLSENGYKYYVSIRSLPIISSLRNLLLSQDLTTGHEYYVKNSSSTTLFNNNLKINKKILMFDSDISWSLNDFNFLINNENDITVGAYQLVNGNTSIHSLENKPVKPEDFNLLTSSFEVLSSGLGFTSIKQEVFENIKYPWFEINEGNSYNSMIGEDYIFFKKAKDAGYKIICDPRIKLGHVKQSTLYIGEYN